VFAVILDVSVSFETAHSSICCHLLCLSWPIGYVMINLSGFSSLNPKEQHLHEYRDEDDEYSFFGFLSLIKNNFYIFYFQFSPYD